MDAGPSPQCGKGFFSHSQLFVQTLCAVACVNFCVHIKNHKHWQPYFCLGALFYQLLCLTKVRWAKFPARDNGELKKQKTHLQMELFAHFLCFQSNLHLAWLNAMQCKPVKCKCSATDCIFPPPTPAHKWSSRKHQKSVVSLWWLCVWPGEERPGGKVSDGRKVKKNELRQAQKLVKKQQRGRDPATPTWSLLASGLMLLTLVAFCMSFAVE